MLLEFPLWVLALVPTVGTSTNILYTGLSTEFVDKFVLLRR